MSPNEQEKADYAAKHYAVSEAHVETRACEYARSKGCWVAKFKSPVCRGAPDRLFITPSGVVFFIEFKRPTVEKPGKQQKLVIDEIRDHGGVVFVCNDLSKAKEIIDDMITFGAHSAN